MKQHLSAVIYLLSTLMITQASGATLSKPTQQETILYGVAYYEEYLPYDRLDDDISMMKAAGINFVRIAESTWSTVEPSDGVFDFSHIDRVLNAMHKAGIKVVIGTPTYAIPAWLAKKHPAILATTARGQNKFGARQNMDITNPDFRRHAQRVIRKILEHVQHHPAIIGYQVDNETKHYHTSGPNVQAAFVEYMQNKYASLDYINQEFGLAYWSNQLNSWQDFPEIHGSIADYPTTSINASMTSEFAAFQRQLVTEYLAWQVAIVNEYKKPGQFVTQNFDLDWRGYSYGIQTDVDHFSAAKPMDVAGVDIYHPTQDDLTGIEISFAGDLARSMKDGQNYFVIETEAQGFSTWTPYPGQLRLQAYSHLASGANMVAYWHWSSLHNAIETYWKGLLSHDFEPNPTYDEATVIGQELQKWGPRLANLQQHNDVALLFSNQAQTAFNQTSFGWTSPEKYNDILRPFYDALYRMNIGVDFLDPSNLISKMADYKFIVVPVLYAAEDKILNALNQYVKQGGHVLYTFKTGFTNEHVKVRSSKQPGIIIESAGVYYSQFVSPKNVSLANNPFNVSTDNLQVNKWMELLTPTTANVLSYYAHPVWGKYAAITENQYGKGLATYLGFMPDDKLIEGLLKDRLQKAKVWTETQLNSYPIISKSGVNADGEKIHYLFNYSGQTQEAIYPFKLGQNIINNEQVKQNAKLKLAPWDLAIVIEKK